MGMNKLAIISLLWMVSNLAFAQKDLGEITSRYSFTDVVASKLGDSIFILCKGSNYSLKPRTIISSYWIDLAGKQTQVDIPELYDKSICGLTRNKDSLSYYFFEETKNAFTLKSVVHDLQSGSHAIATQEINFPGKLLASYVDKDLFLICSEKGKKGITLLRIKNIRIVDQIFYQLPIDLMENRFRHFSFIEGGTPMLPYEGTALAKIVKTNNTLYVVVDDSNIQDVNQTSFKTIVIKLDLIRKTSMTKYFFEKKNDFRSIIFDDKLFKFTPFGESDYSIYQYETGELLKKGNIVKVKKGDSLIMKAGKVTYSKLKLQNSNTKTFINVDSANQNLVITTGMEAENDQLRILPVPFTPAMIALSLGSALITELNNDSKSYYFSYSKGTLDGGFIRTNKSGLIAQKIDNYETLLGKNDIDVKSKIYIKRKGVVIAIYNENQGKLRIVKFEK
jgi:hypothetical protein